MRSNLFSGVMGGLVVVLLLTASSALAEPATSFGEGVGATFNLGKINKVNQISKLTGATADRMLQVTNTSAANASAGLGVSSRGGAPTITSLNTGGGPALSLVVGSGVAPFVVNSNTKVANLNADLVDGVSGPFLRDEFYTRTTTSSGNNTPNAATTIQASCDAGDELISGGFHNVDTGTQVLANFPNTSEKWEVTIQNDASADTITVLANCQNRVP
ncbi:MAG: hypothetical protein WEB00_07095 [Dehalococcoidia bacterium]